MKRVITYGTFDLFHQGHYNILKRAKALGDYLIVGVTSESYDIERGKLSVRDSLTKRIENVKKTGLVDEVIIEEYLGQKIRDIIKYDVDVFVLGDDWKGKMDHLRQYCEVVYLPRTKNICSTMLRETQDTIYRIGVVLDETSNTDSLDEVKYVSGLHIQELYCSNQEYGQKVCDQYGIADVHTDYESFFENIDIAFISGDPDRRYEYVRKAIEKGIHVISAVPITLDKSKLQELFDLAKEKHVALIEDLTTVYLRAFTQVLWMTQGDIVGKVLSVKVNTSMESLQSTKSFNDIAILSVAMIVKLLGLDITKTLKNTLYGDNGDLKYLNLTFAGDNSVGSIEIGDGVEVENEIVIVGENATIVIEGDWWNTGYFEVKKFGERFVKKYSYNFEGNGFRYILQELSIMLRDHRNECTRMFTNESIKVAELLNEIL